MSISADSPSDDTLGLLLQRQYEFIFGINIVQFSIFFVHNFVSDSDDTISLSVYS